MIKPQKTGDSLVLLLLFFFLSGSTLAQTCISIPTNHSSSNAEIFPFPDKTVLVRHASAYGEKRKNIVYKLELLDQNLQPLWTLPLTVGKGYIQDRIQVDTTETEIIVLFYSSFNTEFLLYRIKRSDGSHQMHSGKWPTLDKVNQIQEYEPGKFFGIGRTGYAALKRLVFFHLDLSKGQAEIIETTISNSDSQYEYKIALEVENAYLMGYEEATKG